MARELTQSLDLFEKKTGEDKVTVEQPVLEEKSSELKVTPYDIPKTWKGSKQGKESIDMSVNMCQKCFSTVRQSQLSLERKNWSMKWAIPKDCMFVHNSFKPSFIQ